MPGMRGFAPGTAVALEEVPTVDAGAFWRTVVDRVGIGCSLSALWAVPDGAGHRLFALLGNSSAGRFEILSSSVAGGYPSLTPGCPSAHMFERVIAEETGLIPEGHPWLKPVRFTSPGARPGVTGFFRIEGPDIHEVAVGPVHAGIIEPGHFRMQAFGEQVLHLEIALGYQHRGIERALQGGPTARSLHYAETLAGDTTIGHATAYAEIIEGLSGVDVPAHALRVRAIALELERVANHVGDLGALANDVGFLPTASFCGRIRGDFLNLTALLCGNRFGRSLIRPGGVSFDLDSERACILLERLGRAQRDARDAVSLLWETPSVRTRLERTGVLSRETCLDLGIVGVAARASGVERDVRVEFPRGAYNAWSDIAATWPSGDVYARARARWVEVEASCAFIRQLAGAMGDASSATQLAATTEPTALAPNHIAATLVEGWRGEICHVATTGSDGRLATYKVVDPSFHNWAGLAQAMRGQAVSDFPLCNKSFNLSYCGHDL